MTKPALSVVEDNPIGEPWSLTAKDVAAYLGLSADEVYDIPEEHLRFCRVKGQRRRYRASDVREYAEERIEDGRL